MIESEMPFNEERSEWVGVIYQRRILRSPVLLTNGLMDDEDDMKAWLAEVLRTKAWKTPSEPADKYGLIPDRTKLAENLMAVGKAEGKLHGLISGIILSLSVEGSKIPTSYKELSHDDAFEFMQKHGAVVTANLNSPNRWTKFLVMLSRRVYIVTL